MDRTRCAQLRIKTGTCGRSTVRSSAHGPEDAAEQVSAEALVGPYVGPMAERRVENAALAVAPRPGQSVVSIWSGAPIHGGRSGVQSQQNMDAAARPAPELVDLVRQPERGAEVGRGRMARVLDEDPDALMPGMPVEDASEQRCVLGNLVPGVARAVNPDETSATSHVLKERQPCLTGQRNTARREEHDGPELPNGDRREGRELVGGLEVRDGETRLATKIGDDLLDEGGPAGVSTMDDVMLVRRRMGDQE